MKKPDFTAEDFTRLANNFYTSKGMVADYNRLSLDSYLINYIEGLRKYGCHI
jgi:hypothetical protein